MASNADLKVYGNGPENLPDPAPATTSNGNAVADPVMPTKMISAKGPAPTAAATPSVDEALAQITSVDDALSQIGGPSSEVAPMPGGGFDSRTDAERANQTEIMQAQNGTLNRASGEPLGRKIIGALPTVMGMGSGLAVGLASGGALAVPAAAGGGAAGYALKTGLEKAIYGIEAPPTPKEYVLDAGKEAVTQGLYELFGQAVGQVPRVAKAGAEWGAQKLASLYEAAPGGVQRALKEFGGNVNKAADHVRTAIADQVEQARAILEGDSIAMIKNKVTTLSERESGDAIKQQIVKDVTERYKPFHEAYQQLDKAMETLPLGDEARLKFTNGLKKWALEKYGNQPKIYNKIIGHVDSLMGANNGLQFKDTLATISGEIKNAYSTGRTDRATWLGEIKDRAVDFMEKQVENLALKVKNGKAEDATFITGLMEQMAKNSKDPIVQSQMQYGSARKYAEKVANDFLSGREAVNAQYATFKEFMHSLEGATKVKGKGGATTDFLAKLADVPSEKLVQKMSDPANSKMLQRMQQEIPAVFDQLAGFQVNQLMDKSNRVITDAVSKETRKVLDLNLFKQHVDALPKEIRSLIFKPEELQTLAQTMKSERLNKLNFLLKEHPELFSPETNPSKLIAAGSRNTQNNEALHVLGKVNQIVGSVLEGKSAVNMVSAAKDLAGMDRYVNLMSKVTNSRTANAVRLATPKSAATRAALKSGLPRAPDLISRATSDE